MKNLFWVIFAITLTVIGCKKQEPILDVKKDKIAGPNHRSGSCSFYQQGIHSLAEFDDLVEEDAWPISSLSNSARTEFRSKLKFMNTNSTSVVVGFGKGRAYDDLGLEDYTELIKLVVGINPDFDFVSGEPEEDENYPTTICVDGYEPRPEQNHYCIVAGGSQCCIPARYNAIHECGGM